MKRKRTHVDYLLDILDNAEKAERFVEGVTQEEFEANDEKYAPSFIPCKQLGRRRVISPNHSANDMPRWIGTISWECATL